MMTPNDPLPALPSCGYPDAPLLWTCADDASEKLEIDAVVAVGVPFVKMWLFRLARSLTGTNTTRDPLTEEKIRIMVVRPASFIDFLIIMHRCVGSR
mmetsp:Transcript_49618/g.67543  ORF Transcript_49618/g.67543 Transcript_49618/m.67543 type:complete len:97 (+) Transcript_49618:383-673(+)